MMKQLHLEELKIKKAPNQVFAKGLDVHIAKLPKVDSNEDPEPDTNDAKEPAPKRQPTLIVDKRATSKIDRSTILQKLQESNVFPVKREQAKSQMPPPTIQEVGQPAMVNLTTKDVNLQEEKQEKQEDEEKQEEEENPAIPKTKKAKHPILVKHDTLIDVDKDAEINGKRVSELIPKNTIHKIPVQTSSFYLNNRKKFIQQLLPHFSKYQKDIQASENDSCDAKSKKSSEFKLLIHQEVVRDYLNLYSPYRGLLLYHGLGSGKTCTSIAIAEGMKSQKKIYVMTLASLKANFFDQMKECGDPMYKQNQYWEFVSIEGQPDLLPILAKTLSLSKETIQKNRGAWMVNVKKASNFADLADEDKVLLNKQLDEMIRSKYIDLNYNGLNSNILSKMTDDHTKNPFDNSVIIIDEAHNFVSRIVNKLKQKNSISYRLYEYLMSAENARVVLLSGTPIINYPNEIGIMFNLLRGYIKTWTFSIVLTAEGAANKPNRDTIVQWLHKDGLNTYDFVEFTGNQLTITRNPFGFINTDSSRTNKSEKKRGKRGGTRKINLSKTKTQRKTKRRRSSDREDADPVSVEKGVLHIHDRIEGSHNDESDETRILRIQTEMEVQRGGAGAFDDYSGIILDETGNISDEEFVRQVRRILQKHGLEVASNPVLTLHKSLPDNPKEFMELFVELNTKEMKNKQVFQKRIVGLSSYFPGAAANLYPRFVPSEEDPVFHIERVPMSEYQFGLYEQIRIDEWNKEMTAAKSKKKAPGAGDEKNELFNKGVSSYRIYSRMCCNFAFPDPPGRPQKRMDEGGHEDEIDLDEAELEAEEKQGGTSVDDLADDKTGGDLDDISGGGKKLTEEEKEARAQAKAEAKEAKAAAKAEAKAAAKADAKADAKNLLIAENALDKAEKVLAKVATRRVKPPPVRKTIKLLPNLQEKVDDDDDKDDDAQKEKLDTQTEADEQVEMGPAVKEVFTVDPLALESPEGNMEEGVITENYAKRIMNALATLKRRSSEVFSRTGLETYSPKFLRILDNIQNKDNKGLHLIYSQFRSIEGIGILKLVLEENGFAEFKIAKNPSGEWELDIPEADLQKPRFLLYTGTETDEEKKITLNIYNGRWNEVPLSIISSLEKLHPEVKNNMNGEIIQILMITSSGAEGINLKNTRFVHIVEPYWHMVRLDQVIGRARRICSHQDLPEELRTVQVFLYMSVLLPEQLKGEDHIHLRLHDVSKLSKKMTEKINDNSKLARYLQKLDEKPAVATTDQVLFENALRKDHVNMQILNSVKETAIDCTLFGNKEDDDNLKCYQPYGTVKSNAFASNPDLTKDFAEKDIEDAEEKTVFYREIVDPKSGIKYMMDTKTKNLYAKDQFDRAKKTGETLIPVGNLR